MNFDEGVLRGLVIGAGACICLVHGYSFNVALFGLGGGRI